MGSPAGISRALAGIPVIRNATERDALFPSPVVNQRVHNLDSGTIQRFTGSGWVDDFFAGALSTGTPAVWVNGVQVLLQPQALDFRGGVTVVANGPVAEITVTDESEFFNIEHYGAVRGGVQPCAAAFEAAHAAAWAAGGGCVLIPTGRYLVERQVNILHPTSQVGLSQFGSQVIIPPTFPVASVFRWVPQVGDANFKRFSAQDFCILAESGTPGQYGILFDATAAPIANWSILRVQVEQLGIGPIHLYNPVNIDGIFSGQVEACTLVGTTRFTRAGDSLRFIRNTLTGVGVGITGDFVFGARNFVFAENNCTPNAGVLDLFAAYSPLVIANTMEPVVGGSYPAVPLLRFRGAPGGDAFLLYEPMIVFNDLLASLVPGTDAIWLDYVLNAFIGPQAIYASDGGVGVRCTVNTRSPRIDVQGMSWAGAGMDVSHQVVDPSGTAIVPLYAPLATQPDFNAIAPGSTNVCLQSDTLDQAPWAGSGATVTPDTLTAPDGTMTGDTVTRATSGANNWQQVLTLTDDGTKVLSFYVHPLTSAQANLALYDNTANAFRHQVAVTWPGGVPMLTHVNGAGRLFTVEPADYGWARVAFTADAVLAANANAVVIFPSPAGANGDTVGVWRVQVEDRAVPFNAIQTTTVPVWSSGAGGGGGASTPGLAAVLAVSTAAGAKITNLTDPTANQDAATKKYVDDTAGGAPVSSVFGRTGAVVKVAGDYAVADVTGAAPLASPALTGNPTVPTQAPSDNSTRAASTAYADAAVAVLSGTVTTALALKAPLASPALTGVPTAPTAAGGTNTTQLATTAFVQAATGAVTSVFGRTGTVVKVAGDYAVADVTGAAPLASPALTGNPTVPTQAASTNNTRAASTAYADAAVAVLSGTVTTALALKAPLASPALTGVPTAPTAGLGTNTTQLATTAFVLANGGGGGGAVNPSSNDFRLTLESGVPLSITDQVAKTTVYLTPFKGQHLSLYTGSAWTDYATAQLSLALGSVTNAKNYDIFVYDVTGTPTMILGPAWTSDTARGAGAGTTELTTQDGIYVNANAITSGPGAKAGRYVGTLRTTSGTTTEDSAQNAFLWNVDNSVNRAIFFGATTASWTRAGGMAYWNNTSTNVIGVVVGLPGRPVRLQHNSVCAATIVNALLSIGYDSPNLIAAANTIRGQTAISANAGTVTVSLVHCPTLGYHFYAGTCGSDGTGTFYGLDGGGFYNTNLEGIFAR